MITAELKFFVIRYTSSTTGIGSSTIRIKPFMVRTLFPILHTIVARNKIIHSFATSAGCRFIGTPGILIHRLAPWDSTPRGVKTSGTSAMETTYPRKANRSHRWYGIFATIVIKTSPMITAISCFFR